MTDKAGMEKPMVTEAEDQLKPTSEIMNGKRSHEPESVISENLEDIPLSKKSKTTQNGVLTTSSDNGESPNLISNQTDVEPALQNGCKEDSKANIPLVDTEKCATDLIPKPAPSDEFSKDTQRNGLSVKDINSQNEVKPLQSEKPGCNGSSTLDLKTTNERTKLTLDPAKLKKETNSDSQKESEPEIITLSDSEDEFQEVLLKAMSVHSSDATRYSLLKLYQDQLRVEETKLILLRKLKQSLSHAVPPSDAMSVSAKMMGASSSNHQGRSPASSGQVPPPLKKGHHHHPQHTVTLSSNSSQQQQHSRGSPGHFNQSQHHSSNDRIKSSHHVSGSHTPSGPPPLVNMAKNNSPNNQMNGNGAPYSNYQATPVREPKKATPPAPPPLTKEQKLAGARTLLKKQLEQALRQVPAPKPPPPEVNFLPSLASGEFVYMIGMEEVVKQLLSTEQKDVKFVFNPFSCVQCKTDFTPVWKRDKPGSKNVICERCITSNQKRLLKSEHTAKLKTVFSKALQKEQEIERRVATGSPLSDMPGIAAAVQPSRLHPASSSYHQQVTPTPSMPQLTPQHNNSAGAGGSSASPSSQLTGGQLTTSQLQQHQQALLQAQAAEQMRAMLAAQMAMPYQMFGVQNKQAVELQRQYLLDMINPSRSWKT